MTDNPILKLYEQLSSCPNSPGTCSTPIDGCWDINLFTQPTPAERVFNYSIFMCRTMKLGAAYHDYSPCDQHNFVGLCPHELIRSTHNSAIQLAVADSLLSNKYLNTAASSTFYGSPAELASERARIVVRLAESVAGQLSATRIVIIGASSELINYALSRGAAVRVHDLDEMLIGRSLGGVEVLGPDYLQDSISWANLAIVTGMTIANSTLTSLVELCRSTRTRIILYAESGPTVAQYLVDTGYIDGAVSETFPYYIFGGQTTFYAKKYEKVGL